MSKRTELKKIKQIVKQFFEKMCFDVEIELGPQKDSTLPILIKSEEPKILIGERGQTLSEIQRLLRIILRKGLKKEMPFYINLDVNDYKKKKTDYLKELARSAADDVVLSKKQKELSPMPAFERRIIHLELAERDDVATESFGMEPERKVIVRPYP